MAPGTLIFRFLSKKISFGVFIKKSQNSLVFRNLRLIFQFLPLAPNFLDFTCKFSKIWFFTKIFRYFEIYFVFWPLGPYFLGFYMKNFIFFIFHQIGSKYLNFEKFPVNFGFLAPSPLFFGFSKFGCFTKMAQNTLLLRYLRLRFGFWPLAPNFLGYHLKNVKFPILTKKTKVFRYLGFIFLDFRHRLPII